MPRNVEVAACTRIPLTANTTAKKPTNHSRTARPVSSRGLRREALMAGSPSGPEEVVAHFSDLAGIDVDQFEQNGGRGRRRRRAVVGDHDAHFAGLVGADRYQLAAVLARRQADEID